MPNELAKKPTAITMNKALADANVLPNVVWLASDQQQRLAESGQHCYINDIYEKERTDGKKRWHIWFTVDNVQCAVSWNFNPHRDVQLEVMKPLLRDNNVIGPVVLRAAPTEYDNNYYYFEDATQAEQIALTF